MDPDRVEWLKDYIVRRHRNLDRDLLPYGDPAGKDVLVFGCGWGTEVLWAMKQGARSILGVDKARNSEEPLKLAMEEVGVANAKCEIRQQSISETALGSERFDLIISNGVFEHVMDLKGVFYAFRTLLRPKGRISIFADALWFSSIGGHTGLEEEQPWAHLLHDPSHLHDVLSPNRWRAYSSALNHMTIADFIEAIRNVGLIILQMKLNSDKNVRVLPEALRRVQERMTVSPTDMSVVSIGCELCFAEHI